jgi:hypothetical protein
VEVDVQNNIEQAVDVRTQTDIEALVVQLAREFPLGL